MSTLNFVVVSVISIHSLRVEGDRYDGWYTVTYFRFQSTPSVWRETTKNY